MVRLIGRVGLGTASPPRCLVLQQGPNMHFYMIIYSANIENVYFLQVFLGCRSYTLPQDMTSNMTKLCFVLTGVSWQYCCAENICDVKFTLLMQALLLIEDDELTVLVRLLQHILTLLHMTVIVFETQKGWHQGHIGLKTEQSNKHTRVSLCSVEPTNPVHTTGKRSFLMWLCDKESGTRGKQNSFAHNVYMEVALHGGSIWAGWCLWSGEASCGFWL